MLVVLYRLYFHLYTIKLKLNTAILKKKKQLFKFNHDVPEKRTNIK